MCCFWLRTCRHNTYWQWGSNDVSQDEENSMCSEAHCEVVHNLNLTSEYNGSSFSCRAQKKLLPAVESDPSLVLLQGIFLLNYIA